MASKAVISLSTGLEDAEKVTVAFLVAVGAAEQGRPTLMFCTKEAVRLTLDGVAQGTACVGCPPLAELAKRYEAAGGRYLVCPSASPLSNSTTPAWWPTPRWVARCRCGNG
jgi:predicted peroxiredoxin